MDRELVDPALDAYLHGVLPKRPPVVEEMEEVAKRLGFPIVGPLVGQLFSVLARGIGARRVFELGSGYGYSTWWFADAVGPGGSVVHTDGDADNTRRAKQYLERAGLADRVRFETGDAREIFRRDDGPFDIVFCDIDKDGYPDVPPLAIPRLRVGGLLIFDNMTWHGRILDAPADQDEETRGVIETTRLLNTHPQLLTTILPLRDGVSVSVRTA